MKTINTLTVILMIVGGLNWGLVGLFGFDLVKTLLGDMSLLSRIVYLLVGISAAYNLRQLVGSPQPQAATQKGM